MPTEILYSVIGGLVAVLGVLIVYIWKTQASAGERLEQRVRELFAEVFKRLDDLMKSHHNIETDLRGRLADLDRRVVRIEARCPAACQEQQR